MIVEHPISSEPVNYQIQPTQGAEAEQPLESSSPTAAPASLQLTSNLIIRTFIPNALDIEDLTVAIGRLIGFGTQPDLLCSRN